MTFKTKNKKDHSLTKDIAIQFQNVSFSYEEKLILSGASFKVMPGELIGVIGPNGGGKTTLLKLLMGFLTPNNGTVKIFGKPPNHVLHKLSYVPQNLTYDKKFPISVKELVLSGLLSKLPWYGRYTAKQRAEAEKAMQKVNILHCQESPIGSLSGGQMQRALIARALISEPEVLLLDEPTANIDPQAEQDIYALLKKLSGKMTILMVTHDLKTAIDQVDRVLCVQGNITTFKTKEVCEHFALGLYHAPLIAEDAPCCSLQVKSEKEPL